jgi:pimeloyl-ACP methyl ester carboxylesterase
MLWVSLKGDTTGYLALDRTNKLIILAYRGTVSDENGLTDLQFQHVDASSVCAGCKAHTGFWQASSESMTTLLPQIKSAAKDNKDYKIVFVGHSLGGALATLSAVTMRKLGHTVDLVSVSQFYSLISFGPTNGRISVYLRRTIRRKLGIGRLYHCSRHGSKLSHHSSQR